MWSDTCINCRGKLEVREGNPSPMHVGGGLYCISVPYFPDTEDD